MKQVITYEGAKTFRKFDATLKITIVNHIDFHCMEIIIVGGRKDKKSYRKYLDSKILLDKISDETLANTFQIKQNASFRLNKSVDESEMMTEIATKMINSMIVSRLSISESRVRGEFNVFLEPNESDSVILDRHARNGEYYERIDFELASKPHALVPYRIALTKQDFSTSSSTQGQHPNRLLEKIHESNNVNNNGQNFTYPSHNFGGGGGGTQFRSVSHDPEDIPLYERRNIKLATVSLDTTEESENSKSFTKSILDRSFTARLAAYELEEEMLAYNTKHASKSDLSVSSLSPGVIQLDRINTSSSYHSTHSNISTFKITPKSLRTVSTMDESLGRGVLQTGNKSPIPHTVSDDAQDNHMSSNVLQPELKKQRSNLMPPVDSPRTRSITPLERQSGIKIKPQPTTPKSPLSSLGLVTEQQSDEQQSSSMKPKRKNFFQRMFVEPFSRMQIGRRRRFSL